MAITYKLENQRVTFNWDRQANLWTVKSDDIEDLNLEAKNFNSILKMLKNKHPELSTSIRVFFPGSANA